MSQPFPPDPVATIRAQFDQFTSLMAELVPVLAAYHERLVDTLPPEVAAGITLQFHSHMLHLLMPLDFYDTE